MVGAIVLAAGESTRMGRQKLLLPFAGSTVIEHIVSELRRAESHSIHVVTGHDKDAVADRLAHTGVALVDNPDYKQGMLSSVRAGLRSAPRSWTAALVVLGDQPLLRANTVETLVAAHGDAPDRILVPVRGGRRGHPLLLPAAYWREVLTQFDDVGLRGVLRAHSEDVLELAMEGADVLNDMDYPEDYRAALAAFGIRQGHAENQD